MLLGASTATVGGPPWLTILTLAFGLVSVVVTAWLGPAAVARVQARRRPPPEAPPESETAQERAITALDLVRDAMQDLRGRLDRTDDHEVRIGKLEDAVFPRRVAP